MTNQHPPHVSGTITDAEINEITLNTLGKWPSFEAQSWACRVVHEVLAAMQPDPQPVASEPVAKFDWIKGGVRFAVPKGNTRHEMREWLRESEEGRVLYQHGDCLLVWANEGDLFDRLLAPATPSSAPASVAEAWQPIATAPKDGSIILTDEGVVYFEGYRWILCAPDWRDGKPNTLEYSCADNGCFEVEPSIWMRHPYDPALRALSEESK